MRTIERATAFRRDFKALRRNPRHPDLDRLLAEIVAILAADVRLAERYRDHALSGPWSGYRDCHVKPDLLLIYRKTDDNLLRLARLGSHSDLFRK